MTRLLATHDQLRTACSFECIIIICNHEAHRRSTVLYSLALCMTIIHGDEKWTINPVIIPRDESSTCSLEQNKQEYQLIRERVDFNNVVKDSGIR